MEHTAVLVDRHGLLLDRYEPIRRLGSGAFGTVWLARDTKLDRQVALKRVPVSDPGVAERARREALAAARLQHSSIVSLFECATEEDAVYLISEHVRGGTLAELQEQAALSDRAVIEIGLGLCDALEHAHRRGVVHRDVKPQNVMIADAPAADGSTLAKLTDFGIARLAGDDGLTATGDVVGTLAYMAPEQAEGREANESSDLYSLALCLYEAFSGTNPIRARGAAATARRVGTRLPPLGRLRRDLPLELCAAIDGAVAPDPLERGTVRDLRRALAAAAGSVGDQAGAIAGPALDPLAVALPGRALPMRRRAACAIAAAILCYLGLGSADPPLDPVWLGAAAAALVAALPRAGWVLGALAGCLWLAVDGQPGTAIVVCAALAPVPLVLWRAEWAWSLPGAAPALGVGAVAGIFPLLAGQLPRALDRLALGAAGAWWALLAAPLVADELLAANVPEAGVPWRDSATTAVERVIAPLLGGPELVVCAVWGVAAMVLPWIVRGRNLAYDFVAATAWTATTASATGVCVGAGAPSVAPAAVLAGCGALALAVVRASTGEQDLP